MLTCPIGKCLSNIASSLGWGKTELVDKVAEKTGMTKKDARDSAQPKLLERILDRYNLSRAFKGNLYRLF